MKLMHTTTTTLNTREFNKLSDNIIAALYKLNSEIRDLYDIHINYIKESWRIDFLPIVDNLPVIQVDTYTENDNSGSEILKIIPSDLTDIPEKLKFKQSSGSYDLCVNYVSVFEFILSLYDFEFKLN